MPRAKKTDENASDTTSSTPPAQDQTGDQTTPPDDTPEVLDEVGEPPAPPPGVRLTTAPDAWIYVGAERISPNGTLEVIASRSHKSADGTIIEHRVVEVNELDIHRIQLVRRVTTTKTGKEKIAWEVYGSVIGAGYIPLELDDCPLEVAQAIEWLETGGGSPI